ncbi:MAG: exodeoxyribonuclease VII large subunit [Chthoniobacterales bacterium]
MDELFTSEPQVLTVGELTRSIRDLLEGRLGDVWVEGEISNHRKQASGHQYFTLKDDRAQLACVLFARTATRQKLTDGMAVQVFGNVTVYEARGQYQMIVQKVQPRGQGALQAKFEALKRKLDAEGLFDVSRKLALPKFPRTIGLVTSPTGAALQDMVNVFARRAPWLRWLLIPVKVQGAEAAAEIAGAIRQFNADHASSIDVLVVGRGGGSIEDLWPFNEEIVARAIHASSIPIVSAVGHEIDFTIADFVADLRAPTPSAAAEMVVPDGEELAHRLRVLTSRLRQCLQATITHEKEKLTGRLAPALQREVLRIVEQHQQSADFLASDLALNLERQMSALEQRFARALGSLQQHRPDQILALKRQSFQQKREQFLTITRQSLAHRKNRLEQCGGLLRVLGPESTLKRGYSILTRADGSVVTSAAAVAAGETLRNRLSDGEIISTAN